MLWTVRGNGGRGVKEKDGVAQSVKEKSEAIKDVVAPSIMVESGTGTQESNSIKADRINMHDENVGKTPKTLTDNTPSMSSYANVAGALITLVDDDSKPVEKVDYLGDHDCEDDVASTANDMANFMASEKVGYGDNSLLEQWRDSYENDDYDFDPYDDDMYDE
ncbi:hypothetical protein Tco_1228331 [Tanacetum coccineum]